MDALLLSRLQFALTTSFHFLFVPLTLGLSVIVAIMETLYVKSGDADYLRMTRFWGKILIINFIVGVATGLTLEFQFGTNWSRYSQYVGDIFGSLLAIEATAAFFMESILIAVWIFGWKKLSPKLHATIIWLVAAASTFSALWILIANSWMQHPVGYAIRNGRAELTDFFAVVMQSYSILTFLHVTAAAYILSGFFVMGVSAYHLLKKQHSKIFIKSFKIALYFTLLFSTFAVVEGHMHGADLADKQPAKLAALESVWETASHSPIYIVAIPKLTNDGNLIEFGKIPAAMSILAHHRPSSTVKGLTDFPAELRPPVIPVFFSFRLMVGMGGIFMLLMIYGWFRRNKLESSPAFLRVMFYSIPLPYLVCLAGWTVTEMGRQPWIVYGLMKTSDAVSHIAPSQVALSLAAFIITYTLIGITTFMLIAKVVRQGPEMFEKEDI